MRETRQSGSEGGARLIPCPYPIDRGSWEKGITANHAKYAKREVEQTFMAADADLAGDYAKRAAE
jgi:hypothetical protein